MLPNAPFNRRNLNPRAQVCVHPLTCIQLPARKLKGYDIPFFNQTQLDVLIARRRRNRMPMGQMNVCSEIVNRVVRRLCRSGNNASA
jgi:hypothetical protein